MGPRQSAFVEFQRAGRLRPLSLSDVYPETPFEWMTVFAASGNCLVTLALRFVEGRRLAPVPDLGLFQGHEP